MSATDEQLIAYCADHYSPSMGAAVAYHFTRGGFFANSLRRSLRVEYEESRRMSVRREWRENRAG